MQSDQSTKHQPLSSAAFALTILSFSTLAACSPDPGSSPTDGAAATSLNAVNRAALAPSQWSGWLSGASGLDSGITPFGDWRGSPVTIVGTWADAHESDQTELYSLQPGGPFGSWTGAIDVATGGLVPDSDETYADAAAGRFDDRWTRQAKKLQQLRGSMTSKTIVRPFHEFNGNWYRAWFVTPANVDAYKAAFRRYVAIMRANFPEATIAWSANGDSSPGAAPLEAAWPGEDVVDVISIDSYNGYPVVTDPSKWVAKAMRGTVAEPAGPERWRVFAQAKGKPLAISEWALSDMDGGGDNPEYIRAMNTFISEHAAHPGDTDVAGKVVYDVYFNVPFNGKQRYLIRDGISPMASDAYRNLKWGNASSQAAGSGDTASQSPADVARAEPSTPAPASAASPAPAPSSNTPAAAAPAPAATPKPVAAPVSVPATSIKLLPPEVTVAGDHVDYRWTVQTDQPVQFRYLQLHTGCGLQDISYQPGASVNGSATWTSSQQLNRGTYSTRIAYQLEGGNWVEGPATTYTVGRPRRSHGTAGSSDTQPCQ